MLTVEMHPGGGVGVDCTIDARAKERENLAFLYIG